MLPGSKTCADITCENGGSCIEVTRGGIKCTCTSGFIGTHCEERTFQRQMMGFHKSTLAASGADTQLDRNCVLAPLATNVDLFVCFEERLFKSSSISC